MRSVFGLALLAACGAWHGDDLVAATDISWANASAEIPAAARVASSGMDKGCAFQPPSGWDVEAIEPALTRGALEAASPRLDLFREHPAAPIEPAAWADLAEAEPDLAAPCEDARGLGAGAG
jgi:hypothetical protein